MVENNDAKALKRYRSFRDLRKRIWWRWRCMTKWNVTGASVWYRLIVLPEFHFEVYQKFSKIRIVELEIAMIQTDDQMLLAQQCVANLRRILLEARKVHSAQDYLRLAEPILIEVQHRAQEIFEYLAVSKSQYLAKILS
jgi:hypothetical protein